MSVFGPTRADALRAHALKYEDAPPDKNVFQNTERIVPLTNDQEIRYILSLKDRYPKTVCVNADEVFTYGKDSETDFQNVTDAVRQVITYCGGVKFHIGILSIRCSDGENHANALVSDTTSKIMYRFEPHGGSLGSDMYDSSDLDKKLRTSLEENGWEYVPPHIVCPKSGPQTLQQDMEGFCASWSLYFIDRWLANNGKLTPEETVHEILKGRGAEELDTLIRDFREKVSLPFDTELFNSIYLRVNRLSNAMITPMIVRREVIRVLGTLPDKSESNAASKVLMRISNIETEDVFKNLTPITDYADESNFAIDKNDARNIAKSWLKYASSNLKEKDKIDFILMTQFIFDHLMKIGKFKDNNPMENASIKLAVDETIRLSQLPLKESIVIEEACKCTYTHLMSNKRRVPICRSIVKRLKAGDDVLEDNTNNKIAIIAHKSGAEIDDARKYILLIEWFSYLADGTDVITGCNKFMYDAMARHGWTTRKINFT